MHKQGILIMIAVIIITSIITIIMVRMKKDIATGQSITPLLIIPPQESAVSFFGKIIPETKKIVYKEPLDGGVQLRAVIIPLHDTRYVVANFEWVSQPVSDGIGYQTEDIYLFNGDTFSKVAGQLELYGNDVRGNVTIDRVQTPVNVPESEFVDYDGTDGAKDLLRRLPLQGFTVTK